MGIPSTTWDVGESAHGSVAGHCVQRQECASGGLRYDAPSFHDEAGGAVPADAELPAEAVGRRSRDANLALVDALLMVARAGGGEIFAIVGPALGARVDVVFMEESALRTNWDGT